MDGLFEIASDQDADGGMFAAEVHAGRADGLGWRAHGVGTREVVYLSAVGGAKVTGEVWSDGPEVDTVWVLCSREYAAAGAIVVDTVTFRERPELRAKAPKF